MYVDLKGLKENPNKTANFFSKLTFGWVVKLFAKGLKRQLNVQDLFKPMKSDESAQLGNQLEYYWENELARARLKKQKPKLVNALHKLFFKKSFICGLMLLIYSLISIVQPMLLAELLILITKSKEATPDERKLKYIYGGLIAIINLIRMFIYNHQLAYHFLLGMKIRIACSSLLYRKVMRLSHSSISKITAGQLVNFLSNDVTRFDFGIPWIHHLWIMPIQLVVGTLMIWYQVGISSLAGVLTMFIITIPIQGLLGKLSSKFRLKVANRSDVRVKHMTELINGIQVIKMYAWEKPFEKLIEKLRKFEVSAIRNSSMLKAVYLSFIVFTDRLSLFATIACYVLLGHYLSADKVFSLAQFFNVMQISLAIGFPLAINMGAEMLVSIRRFEEYLDLHEKETSEVDEPKSAEICVALDRVHAAWVPNEWKLSNLTLHIPNGSLCILVGSVGSGKSSILHLLLGELLPSSGTISKSGEISYASQEPWLFVGSVRDNILFGTPYIREKYREVVRVCALEKDFQQFPYGDKTLVGERGVALSGGQRARINLARAVYRQADVYMLDDPLSAVDTHVSKHLFQECIAGYLGKKTRILVTHQLQFLNRADIIVVIDDGQIVSQGTYQEISKSNLDIKQILHIDKPTEKPKESEAMKLERKNSTLSTASTVIGENEIDQHDEEMGTSSAIFWPYFKASGSVFLVIVLFLALLLAQAVLNGSDLFLTYWTSEIRASFDRTHPHHHYNSTEIVINQLGNNETDINQNSSYHFYNTTNTETNEDIFVSDAFTIYAGLIGATVVLTIIRAVMFMYTCMKSSINLHGSMFNSLMRAVMRFFDNNPSGRILNRFSKDMGTMDEILPKTMLEAIQVILVMTGILVVIIITNVFMAIAIVLLLLIGYKLATVYTKTAKDIKRLEGITKSPVFSHIKASYDGLTTIRSSHAETHYVTEFDLLQDLHTSSWYLTVASRTAFGIYIDFFTVLFISIVIFSFLLLNEVNDIFDASKAGLAISQSMILTGMVQLGSQQATEVVNQMMSVERILEYTKLEKETLEDGIETSVESNWPSRGLIKFKNMYLRYQLSDPPVLKNLNFSILPGQKVGIVGRTGAGKSSIISALFLLSTIEGNIYIDNVDTKKVNLSLLRAKISIIPQKPVLFSSSVRDNLDPFNEFKDEDIWSAINEVEMKSGIPSLEYMVHEGGINFSVGQRQLLCLARAILRNNKILVLDEATANVDQQTDALIQSTIRRKFNKCTVLTIAHRLNTIMDSDIVFVMHAGELVESGHPHKLLQNFNGYFFKLVADNEESEARRLHSIANQTYLSTVAEVEEVTTL